MKRISRSVLIAIIAFFVIVFGVWGYQRWIRTKPLPQGLIQANGRIEGDTVRIAAKFSGRIHAILVNEGDSVKQGQVLVQMDDVQAQARVAQARASIQGLEAELASAQAAEAQAGKDNKRFQALAARGTVDRRRAEEARLAWTRARGALEALLAKQAEANAALDEAQSVLSDMTVKAPASGTIVTRIVQEGEVVASGAPLLDLVNLGQLYLKVYIPESDLGKIRLGNPARIYTDAFPDQPVPATVRFISPRAEFTPKEVQTPDERVKLVYFVKLYLDANPDQRMIPGLPADAVIRWKPEIPWERPRW